MRSRAVGLALFLSFMAMTSVARAAERVIDVPTRAGVTQRFLLISNAGPKATVVLFAGGHGGLQLDDAGRPHWGRGNFLVRSAGLFAEQGLAVAVIDAPSDRLSPPHLDFFRQTAEHAADVKAVIGRLRDENRVPVWLVGTSRGTQSVAFVATRLQGNDGPDGIVLTSTILADKRSRPVPDMPLDVLKIPVLVVHHEQDGCQLCRFSDMPYLMSKLSPLPRKQLITFRGGENQGHPCEAFAYHGYNGLESEVVGQIAAWITAK